MEFAKSVTCYECHGSGLFHNGPGKCYACCGKKVITLWRAHDLRDRYWPENSFRVTKEEYEETIQKLDEIIAQLEDDSPVAKESSEATARLRAGIKLVKKIKARKGKMRKSDCDSILAVLENGD